MHLVRCWSVIWYDLLLIFSSFIFCLDILISLHSKTKWFSWEETRPFNIYHYMLFFQSEIRKKYWLEACSTAIYTINRLSSRILSYESPFSLLYKKESKLEYLRAFGSLCFPLVPKQLRDKFQSTPTYCCFLGYSPSQKAYKCLRLQSHNF